MYRVVTTFVDFDGILRKKGEEVDKPCLNYTEEIMEQSKSAPKSSKKKSTKKEA